MMGPILKQVASEMGNKVRILKVDVDKNPAIAQKWSISGVPTLMVFKNGKQLFRQSGVVQAGQIVQLLQGFL